MPDLTAPAGCQEAAAFPLLEAHRLQEETRMNSSGRSATLNLAGLKNHRYLRPHGPLWLSQNPGSPEPHPRTFFCASVVYAGTAMWFRDPWVPFVQSSPIPRTWQVDTLQRDAGGFQSTLKIMIGTSRLGVLISQCL